MNDRATEIELWPIVILQDRYAGVYSGGEWIAIAGASRPITEAGSALVDRLDWVTKGAWDEDVPCADFWGLAHRLSWVAVGESPQKALKRLKEQHIKEE